MKRQRWMKWLAITLVVFAVVAFAVGEYVVRHAEPMLRARLVAYLEDRFHSPVQLDALHLSLVKGLGASGDGLRIVNLAGADRPDSHTLSGQPMLSVKHFEFHAGLMQLFEPTMRIGTVYVQGLEINIPPKQMRAPMMPTKRKPGSHTKLAIDRIQCTDAVLRIETLKPGRPPLEFDIHDLVLTEIAPGTPMKFVASLMNAKPVGEIHSEGHFGPWDGEEPRNSKIDGTYTFANADLGPIKGIAGILQSTGQYSGVLGEIAVNGTTDIPDFQLDMTEHPVPLHTDFQAVVDGTTGDTILKLVRARLLNTVLDATGAVLRASSLGPQPAEKLAQGPRAATLAPQRPGDGPLSQPRRYGPDAPGHDIELTVTTEKGRIEDMLRLAVKTSPPLMRGALKLKTHLSIPPGTESVSRRIKLDGTFAISGVTLSNPSWQEKIDTLSERAQGHPKLANAADAERVNSDMHGRFMMGGGVIHLPELNYSVPGAEVRLAGEYGIDGQRFEFGGVVRTDATASEMLTGWKSVLAKPFNKMLEKHGAGLEVPVKISGTKSEPKFGLDLDKMGLGFLNRHKDKDEGAKPPAGNSGTR